MLASNVVSGISITNAFITNSTFAGNGGWLTNLNAGQLSGSATLSNLTLGGTLVLPVLPAVPVCRPGQRHHLRRQHFHFCVRTIIIIFLAGPYAGNTTLSGSDNTGIGQFALINDTSGSDNTASGFEATLLQLDRLR